MLNLILTDTLVSQPITDALASRYGKGGNHLVIVPDRFTLSYERVLLRRLGLKGAFDIEVASFSRLADVALAEGHKGALNSLSEVMLLRKVIEDNRSLLKCFFLVGIFGILYGVLRGAVSDKGVGSWLGAAHVRPAIACGQDGS